MKKFIVTAGFFLLGLTAFCQQEQNGTIYIKHPYIDAVNNVAKAYMAQDEAANKMLYSDTAKYWVSGLDDFIPIADAFKMWSKDFEYFDDITMKTFGYPDYLHYKKADSKVVQSWWTWSGKSKKTGEVIKVPIVMFDDFNDDGKIVREYIFGDFSKVVAEEM
ncbi:hypothetical protein BH20BAC1_BH20BAC1_16820 [soil metagenome]